MTNLQDNCSYLELRALASWREKNPNPEKNVSRKGAKYAKVQNKES